MHSKLKGNIGELKVAAKLSELGYSVFKELGDLSKIDLIIEKNYKLIKFQVKAVTSKNGVVHLKSTKSGPNYQFSYNENHVDFFALYLLDLDRIAFIPIKNVIKHDTTTLRISKTKNNQKKFVKPFEKFECLEEILRDFTPNTCNGDDKVQTTTK
jgi:hypothetical protein